MTATQNMDGLECPKCGATPGDLRFVFLMETQCHIKKNSLAELVVDSGYVVDPPGGSKPFLLCLKCATRWPLPTGITVLMKGDGQTTKVFEPDGRTR